MNENNKIGIGFYKEEQWETLKALAVDKEHIENTFSEYKDSMNKSIREMKKIGLDPIMIPIDVLEAYVWCQEKSYPFDGESRASYISLKTQKYFRK